MSYTPIKQEDIDLETNSSKSPSIASSNLVGLHLGRSGLQRAVRLIGLFFGVLLPWAATIYLMGRLHQTTSQNPTGHTISGATELPQILYSPAQHVLEYEFQKFDQGFGWATSKYQGEPSPELDAAWDELYHGIIYSRIPKAQAAMLPNKTSAIPGDGHYIIMLNVFHELHCLNMVRKRLHPEYYDPEDSDLKNFFDTHHIDHCIDSIRASLMCSADISPMVWQWWEPAGKFEPRNDIVHTCRKWDNIHEWARQHKILGPVDYTAKTEDDIVIETF